MRRKSKGKSTRARVWKVPNEFRQRKPHRNVQRVNLRSNARSRIMSNSRAMARASRCARSNSVRDSSHTKSSSIASTCRIASLVSSSLLLSLLLSLALLSVLYECSSACSFCRHASRLELIVFRLLFRRDRRSTRFLLVFSSKSASNFTFTNHNFSKNNNKFV